MNARDQLGRWTLPLLNPLALSSLPFARENLHHEVPISSQHDPLLCSLCIYAEGARRYAPANLFSGYQEGQVLGIANSNQPLTATPDLDAFQQCLYRFAHRQPFQLPCCGEMY